MISGISTFTKKLKAQEAARKLLFSLKHPITELQILQRALLQSPLKGELVDFSTCSSETGLQRQRTSTKVHVFAADGLRSLLGVSASFSYLITLGTYFSISLS